MENIFKYILKIKWLIILLVLAITVYLGFTDSSHQDKFGCGKLIA